LNPRLIQRPALPLEAIGGFLALQSPQASEISADLRERGVWTDYRGEALRLGPAPYLADAQLTDSIGILGEVVRAL